MSRTLRRLLVVSAAALLAATVFAAAPSAALGPLTSTTPTTPTTPTPKPKPKLAKGSLRIYLHDAFFVHRQAVTVPHRGVSVEGVVRPYVAGQWVTVKSFIGRRLMKRQRVWIKPSRRHTYGRFSLWVKSPHVGDVTVSVIHARTRTQMGFKAHRGFSALDRNVGPGSLGRFVQLIQQRLAGLHFYLNESGVYDNGTGLAVDAYHRLLGWGTSQTLDSRTVSFLLNGWGQFKVRYPHHGRHAEGNLSHQLLALINGSKVDVIFPISSGKPSTPTVLGNFHVYRRVPGLQADGMYFSSYFYTGYAIHGYNPAPDYPASHGCMRLPMDDALPVWNWLNFGDAVDVYY